MKPISKSMCISAVIVLLAGAVFVVHEGYSGENNAGTVSSHQESIAEKTLIQVFYKQKENSMQAFEKVKAFLKEYESRYDIRYLLITDPENESLNKSLGLPTEHFPFAIAIDGKTSAMIDGKKIVFAHFPDFMHHIGKHKGNWTLDHLTKVLNDISLMLPDNPEVQTRPGGK